MIFFLVAALPSADLLPQPVWAPTATVPPTSKNKCVFLGKRPERSKTSCRFMGTYGRSTNYQSSYTLH